MTYDWARRTVEKTYRGDIEWFKRAERESIFIDPNDEFDPRDKYLDNISTDNRVSIDLSFLDDLEIEKGIRDLNKGYETIENVLVTGIGDHISVAKIVKEKIPYEKLPNIKVIKYVNNDGGGLNTQATEILMSKLLPRA